MDDGVGDHLAGQQFGSVYQIGQTPGPHKRGHQRPRLPWCQGVCVAIHSHRVKYHRTVRTAVVLPMPMVCPGPRHLCFLPKITRRDAYLRIPCLRFRR
jgi:hypothetical protein